MSGGQRQAIAIARAVHWANRVVFLDEPTAALGVRQTANVLDTIRRVRDQGIAVVFISHSMPHVIEVSDRVQVLRLGRRVATYQTTDTYMEAAGRRDDRSRSGGGGMSVPVNGHRPAWPPSPTTTSTESPARTGRSGCRRSRSCWCWS